MGSYGIRKDDNAINNHYQSAQSKYKDTMDSDGEDVKDLPKIDHISNLKESGSRYDWTNILEAMDTILDATKDANPDMEDESIDDQSNTDDSDLVAELDKVFTPILIMQGMESQISDKIQEAYSEASVLTEKNVIQFDDETRMAQLLSVCALLLQKKKNTPEYQAYKKAAAIRKQMKIEMQKREYDAAKALAQKYLISVSSSNNSSVARKAATDLLPETQH